MKILGLEVGDLSVRVSVLEKKLGSVRVLREDEIPLSQDEEGKTRSIAEALSTLNTDYGLKGVVVGVDLGYFSHHFVNLPVSSREDVANALTFEMEKHLPLPPDEYLSDFIRIETSAAGSTVLVLSLKKDRLNWILKGISEAGVTLRSVRCSVMEALNELLARENAENALFLYKGSREHFIIGIKNSCPSIIKSKVSSNDVNSELRKMTETYNQGIYTLGEIAEGSVEGLESKTLSYSMPSLLALSATKKRALTLNFMPGEYAARKVNYYPYALVTMCAVSVLAFFSTTWLSYYKDYAALESVNAQIDELTRTSSELVQTQREFESIGEKRQFLLNFQKNRTKHTRILRQMSSLLPKEAWITNFSSDNRGRIEIQGYAKRSASLIGPLENSSTFKNVEFSSPVTIRDDQERFSIRMEIEE